MEQADQTPIDLNQATIEELETLPGIGQAMAERIVTGRPYGQMEDLLNIKGLGARSLERIQPLAFISQDATSVDEGQRVPTTGQPEEHHGPSLVERLRDLGRSMEGRAPNSNQVLGLALLTGCLSVILSVLLTLAILAGINRTLSVERHASVRDLRSAISQVESRISNLEASQQSIEQRLQAVEGLSGRMATLEADFDVVQEQVGQMRNRVDQLAEEVETTSQEVMRMSSKILLFDNFLEGLRGLMADLFAPVESTSAP